MKYNKGAILRSIEQPFIKDDVPAFDTGDTVRVDYKVVEGTRSRIQAFEGVVIAKQNGKGARASFTVRKVSFGEGVERVFPLHSPLIDKIDVTRRGRSRRAKLYYLRELRGKAARLKTDVGRQEEDRAAARVNRENKVKADAAAAEQAAKDAAAAEVAAREAAEAEAKAAEEAKAAAEAEAKAAQAQAAEEAKAAEEAAKQEAEAAQDEETAPAEAVTEEATSEVAEEVTTEAADETVVEESAAPEEATPETSVAETADTEETSASADEADDLTKVEGIGPKYAEALIAAGISTYADVAKASEEDFQKAAEAAEMNMAASMATWAKQAQYLVDGDEEGLKAYQDELDGGREA